MESRWPRVWLPMSSEAFKALCHGNVGKLFATSDSGFGSKWKQSFDVLFQVEFLHDPNLRTTFRRFACAKAHVTLLARAKALP